jgi:hypothetical protein
VLRLVASGRGATIVAVALAALCSLDCGRGQGATPTSPTASVSVQTTSLTGTVVGLLDRLPIGGATVLLGVPTSLSTVTDAAGRFAFSSVPIGIPTVTITAPGHLLRVTRVNVDVAPQDVTFDLISSDPPFSLDFYRQFGRNGYESLALFGLRVWTMAPSFYIRTVTQDTGETVSAEVLGGVQRIITNGVPELTGGRYTPATVVTGTDDRPQQLGWVIVNFVHDPKLIPGAATGVDAGSSLAGSSSVGADKVLITLQYDPSIDAQGLYNPWGCESFTIDTMDHEIVHAMGFFHTAQTPVDFQSGYGCPGAGRSANARFHALVAYARGFNNLDIDADPPVNAASPSGMRLVAGPVIADRWSDIVGR